MEEQPEQLKHNEFWGKRAGSYSEKIGNHFKISRGSTVMKDGRGATGHKCRWYFARAWSQVGKPIRNPEHQPKSKGGK